MRGINVAPKGIQVRTKGLYNEDQLTLLLYRTSIKLIFFRRNFDTSIVSIIFDVLISIQIGNDPSHAEDLEKASDFTRSIARSNIQLHCQVYSDTLKQKRNAHYSVMYHILCASTETAKQTVT
jgi:hypothetical protein